MQNEKIQNNLPNTEIKIDEKEPFIINGDPSREKFGKFFCNFLKDTQTPTVIELSAGYGQGKTTFLKMCEQHIKNESEKFNGIEIISLNIWKDDLYNNPLASIIKSICKLEGNEAYKNFIDKIKAMDININLGIVSLSTKDLFDNNKKGKIEELKETFKTIDKKIIFFIDELDRCRPDYAIETLETIKHFFDESNIVFVLATDDNRLQSSVNSVYGSEIANEDYLRKFIDIKFNLPEIENAEKHLLSKRNFSGDTLIKASLRELKIINYYLSNIDIITKATIRKIIKVDLILNKSNEIETGCYINITSLKFMIFLRHIKPNLYFKLGNGICNIEEMITKLKFNNKTRNAKNKLINTKQEFKEFLMFISRTRSENIERLKEIFNDEEMRKIDLIRNKIKTRNVEIGVGALKSCINVTDDFSFNKAFLDKIEKNYMLIFLYSTVIIYDNHHKSIAKTMYDLIENH
ncbi:MAG: P-loop NTPase fold protein [Alphaproteobacteria bacterium]|nr:P-loop NTPase fold protein [Alphaproteobacteria bacterium]